MLEIIWNDLLYRPLFNVLIWMYNNWTDQSLGWAVVYLTIALRILLLPLTVISERNKIKNRNLVTKIEQTSKEFRNDPVQQKQEVRKLIKKGKVRPWIKVLALGIQLLVLVLLYQVFWHGITGEKLIKILYEWVDFPGSINVMFLGFDLGRTHDIIWPGFVALFLLVEIYIDFAKYKEKVTHADLFYFILFPAMSFLVLWILPMVKSLFVLTSMIFSAIVGRLIALLFRPKEEPEKITKKLNISKISSIIKDNL